MEFGDFVSIFPYIAMCHFQFQDADGADVNDKNWFLSRIDGGWNLATAGGCQTTNFCYNQQYLIKIPEMVGDEACSVVFSLLQMNTRSPDAQKHTIGFILYELTGLDYPRNTPLDSDFFFDHKPFSKTDFNVRREVLMREQLKPGLYCLIPSTINEKSYGSFVLRAFTEHPIDIQPLDYQPSNEFRIDKIRIGDIASEKDLELMNMCLNKLKSVHSSRLYAQKMQEILTFLVDEDFLEEHEEIALESCRSYIALISDNNGPPHITKEDFASFLKLIFFVKKAFTSWVNRNNDDSRPPHSIDSLKLQEFLAGIGILMPKKLVAKAASRYMNPDFATSSRRSYGEVDFNGVLNAIMRFLSAIEAIKCLIAENGDHDRKLYNEIMEYLLSV